MAGNKRIPRLSQIPPALGLPLVATASSFTPEESVEIFNIFAPLIIAAPQKQVNVFGKKDQPRKVQHFTLNNTDGQEYHYSGARIKPESNLSPEAAEWVTRLARKSAEILSGVMAEFPAEFKSLPGECAKEPELCFKGFLGNVYRPFQETDPKIDVVGKHQDKELDPRFPVVSWTFYPVAVPHSSQTRDLRISGEHWSQDKKPTKRALVDIETLQGSAVVMFPGMHDAFPTNRPGGVAYWHEVPPKKVNIPRLNFTFRGPQLGKKRKRTATPVAENKPSKVIKKVLI
jgi:hypothetical protein